VTKKLRKFEDVPAPGTESLIPDKPPLDHYLQISVRRRDLLKAQAAYDIEVWKAHRDGVTNTLIARASDITEASVRDRLRRLRRQKQEQLDELERDYRSTK
jgi:hypothetical protein